MKQLHSSFLLIILVFCFKNACCGLFKRDVQHQRNIADGVDSGHNDEAEPYEEALPFVRELDADWNQPYLQSAHRHVKKRDATDSTGATTEIDGNSVSPTWAVDHEQWQGKIFAYDHLRPGQALDEHDCFNVGEVPEELQTDFFFVYRDRAAEWGIPPFYTKYTHAYGIPILSSDAVSDAALMRACYVVRFMLADRYDMRNAVYKLWNKVALMGNQEMQTALPEYTHFDDWWDGRARGLGATFIIPTTSADDGNQRCEQNWYMDQDILVHEFAHTLHTMAAQFTIPKFHQRLMAIYDDFKAAGKWNNTYAMNNEKEMFAIATQMYFNSYRGGEYRENIPELGGLVYMQNRQALAYFSPPLKALIDDVFLCQNSFVHRCQWNECSFEKFQQVLFGEAKRSRCSQIKLHFSQPTAVSCVSWACSQGANAVNYRRAVRFCYALRCDNVGDPMVQDDPYGTLYDSFVLGEGSPKDPPMDLEKKSDESLRTNCAPYKHTIMRGNSRINRCASISLTHCGDDDQSEESCVRKGCCYQHGQCFYPMQDCVDRVTSCPRDSVNSAVCSSDTERCRNSCGNCESVPYYG